MDLISLGQLTNLLENSGWVVAGGKQTGSRPVESVAAYEVRGSRLIVMTAGQTYNLPAGKILQPTPSILHVNSSKGVLELVLENRKLGSEPEAAKRNDLIYNAIAVAADRQAGRDLVALRLTVELAPHVVITSGETGFRLTFADGQQLNVEFEVEDPSNPHTTYALNFSPDEGSAFEEPRPTNVMYF